MTREIRWGVVGPGRIAEKVVEDFAARRRGPGRSRSPRGRPDRAQAFAARHGIDRAHGSYAEILADPEVDVLYVATPHPQHHAIALAALRAGKALLIEKAFTATLAGAAEVVDRARARGVFVMEAMWTRFQPAVVACASWSPTGRSARSSRAGRPGHRPRRTTRRTGCSPWSWAAARCSTSGVYVVSFAQMVLGDAGARNGRRLEFPSGVDAEAACCSTTATGGRRP